MNARAHHLPPSTPEPKTNKTRPMLAGGDMAPHGSPALELQKRISQAMETPFPEPEVEKFHPATRLAIVTAVTVTPWIAIGLAVRAVLRL